MDFQTIRDYFFEYKTAPTLEVMKVKIDELENDILQSEVVDGLKESWRLIQSTDLKFVQEQTLEFCRNQVIKVPSWIVWTCWKLDNTMR